LNCTRRATPDSGYHYYLIKTRILTTHSSSELSARNKPSRVNHAGLTAGNMACLFFPPRRRVSYSPSPCPSPRLGSIAGSGAVSLLVLNTLYSPTTRHCPRLGSVSEVGVGVVFQSPARLLGSIRPQYSVVTRSQLASAIWLRLYCPTVGAPTPELPDALPSPSPWEHDTKSGRSWSHLTPRHPATALALGACQEVGVDVAPMPPAARGFVMQLRFSDAP
jgi:hypothetical protein